MIIKSDHKRWRLLRHPMVGAGGGLMVGAGRAPQVKRQRGRLGMKTNTWIISLRNKDHSDSTCVVPQTWMTLLKPLRAWEGKTDDNHASFSSNGHLVIWGVIQTVVPVTSYIARSRTARREHDFIPRSSRRSRWKMISPKLSLVRSLSSTLKKIKDDQSTPKRKKTNGEVCVWGENTSFKNAENSTYLVTSVEYQISNIKYQVSNIYKISNTWYQYRISTVSNAFGSQNHKTENYLLILIASNIDLKRQILNL